MDNLRLRTWGAIFGVLLATAWILPNFVDTSKIWWPSQRKLNYGLDIQGGLHLVMGADVPGVLTEHTNRLATSLQTEFANDKIEFTSVKVTDPLIGEIRIEAPPESLAKINTELERRYAITLQKISEGGGGVTYRFFESYLREYQEKVIHQAIETIRNRIDEFGVAEPSISQQGVDRILVQLPGMAEAERAKTLIKTAAKLDFMLVEEKDPSILQAWITEVETAGTYSFEKMQYSDYIKRLNEDLKAKLPEKTMILFEKAPNAQSLEAGRIPYLLRTDTNLGGDALSDAFVQPNEFGVPEVGLRFNPTGTIAFRTLTGANVGRRLAVVLDRVVKTAPNLQTQISNGEARITLGSARGGDQLRAEATMIATALRAGSLPAALEQLEERRVGPTLGADSIQAAQLASWIGALAIIIFMGLRYRTMGLIADLAMGLNVLCSIALLTSLGATLTLPGIAGIALTVGFAVDSNVLIFERMREELRKGSSIATAVKEGYNRALSAILDSNLTVSSTAVILLFFGTGPVRGFAVTLLIGIVTTLFANVFVTKVIVDNLIHRFGVKKISI